MPLLAKALKTDGLSSIPGTTIVINCATEFWTLFFHPTEPGNHCSVFFFFFASLKKIFMCMSVFHICTILSVDQMCA